MLSCQGQEPHTGRHGACPELTRLEPGCVSELERPLAGRKHLAVSSQAARGLNGPSMRPTEGLQPQSEGANHLDFSCEASKGYNWALPKRLAQPTACLSTLTSLV